MQTMSRLQAGEALGFYVDFRAVKPAVCALGWMTPLGAAVRCAMEGSKVGVVAVWPHVS